MILDQRELKRRLLLRLKGIESGRALIGPATVHLHLTDLCNLACQYCWYYAPGAIRPSGKDHLPFDLFESIMRDCSDLQVDTIHLSGVGDPTLHPRFYDMLHCLERSSFEICINTNGTFPINRCRDILRADRIIINLGAADRESYQALQGKDLFIRVIKNIRELARLRPQFNPDFSIEVVFVKTSLNVDSLLRTENLVRKLGADFVQKKTFEPSSHNRHIILQEQQEKTEAVEKWPPCYHGWFYSAIKLNGDVNVCCFMQRLTIGNVYTSSFKDMWVSEAYSHARASALTGKDPFRNDPNCLNCGAFWRNKEIAAQRATYNRIRKAG